MSYYRSNQIRAKLAELAGDSLETIAEMVFELEEEKDALAEQVESLTRERDELAAQVSHD